ncbi:conserved hypothetical protein [Anaeromyxobacter dehalogenans 2CP-1]|uniref:Uncharacterized protein n=1 Tax=Anaeromyxobacter dehalogenans (strain ATCC BAA-258 / DSM 21875 / 2CP-1) TaxID=455488 RepID=B8JDE4_ANAD2|nr:hypothetical protein [Anaeromyxobacter dehalogenans]ACL65993.1 conserved hypothetical protein [Anaeromyxobacter dehalogenans 2CP-1]
MFVPDPSITHLSATREQVVAVIESINQPQVSVPGKAPQAVVGHLCGVRNANGTLSIYVGLHLVRTGENVVYVHDRRQLTVEEYRQVEIEGLQFLESMGFMLDNLNFRNLTPDVQEQALRRTPLFSPPRPAAPGAAAPGGGTAPADPARLARLLASF